MNTGFIYILQGILYIAAFAVGRYLFPHAAAAATDLLTQYPWLLQWGKCLCLWAQQFMVSAAGEEKMSTVAQMLTDIAAEGGVTLTLEQAQAICQNAYKEFVAGKKSA